MRVSNSNLLSIQSFLKVRKTFSEIPRKAEANLSPLTSSKSVQLTTSQNPPLFSSKTEWLSPSKPDLRPQVRANGLGDPEDFSAGKTTLEVADRYPLSDNGDFSTSTRDTSPSQDDLAFLQKSIEFTISKEVLYDPEIELTDIEAAIDANFGSGVSDVLDLRYVDVGDGHSSIQMDQINWNDLSIENKEILNSAIDAADEEFQVVVEADQSMEGKSAEQALSQVKEKLGSNRFLFFSNFDSQLKKDPASAISDLKDRLQISGQMDPRILETPLNTLQNLNQSAQKAQSDSPFMDDFAVTFKSYRYARAFSSVDIQTSLDMVINEDFLTK